MKGGRGRFLLLSAAAAVTVPPRPVTPTAVTPVTLPPTFSLSDISFKFAKTNRPGAVNASSVHNGYWVYWWRNVGRGRIRGRWAPFRGLAGNFAKAQVPYDKIMGCASLRCVTASPRREIGC